MSPSHQQSNLRNGGDFRINFADNATVEHYHAWEKKLKDAVAKARSIKDKKKRSEAEIKEIVDRDEDVVRLRKEAPPYCINQRDFLLLEFNEFSIPPSMDQTLHEIQLAGVHPVITHPERNGILRRRPERLKKWVRQGCFAQVTGGSLTGGFGAGSQQVALRWIGEGLIHFVASDAHNTRGRPLRLQPAYDVVVDRFGEEKARALFQDNPLAAFEGRQLPHIPEVEDELPPPRRKRFFFF